MTITGAPYSRCRAHLRRVVVCSKGYCWILQRRRGVGRWESVKFFARRQRLGQVLRQLAGDRAYNAVKAKIEALPL